MLPGKRGGGLGRFLPRGNLEVVFVFITCLVVILYLVGEQVQSRQQTASLASFISECKTELSRTRDAHRELTSSLHISASNTEKLSDSIKSIQNDLQTALTANDRTLDHVQSIQAELKSELSASSAGFNSAIEKLAERLTHASPRNDGLDSTIAALRREMISKETLDAFQNSILTRLSDMYSHLSSDFDDTGTVSALADKAAFQYGPWERRTVIVGILSVLPFDYRPLFLNFITSLHRVNVTQALIFTLDKEAYYFCLSYHEQCVYLLPPQEDLYVDFSAWASIIRTKPWFTRLVLRLGYNVLFTDFDNVFFDHPFKALKGFEDSDVVMSSERRTSETMSSGFYFFRHSNGSLCAAEQWVQRCSTKGSSAEDQGEWNVIVRQLPADCAPTRFSAVRIPLSVFASGCDIKESGEHVYSKAVGVHTNCVWGPDSKIAFMKERNFWFPH